MLVLDRDRPRSRAESNASEEDILIDHLAGMVPIESYFNEPVIQKRKHCRYIRGDIQAAVADMRLLFRVKFKPVRLVDVCQAGVSIGTERKVPCGHRLRLALTFADQQSFEFICVVTNRRPGDDEMIYGLKFERSNQQFEEHLLKTGLKIKLNNMSAAE
ncbi:MAG: hypothetical protein ACU843_03065 [Gammaproteobacteria bacterium]